jgi:hypothetical protein
MLKVRVKSRLKLVKPNIISTKIKKQSNQMYKQLFVLWIMTENELLLYTRKTTLNCSHTSFS